MANLEINYKYRCPFADCEHPEHISCYECEVQKVKTPESVSVTSLREVLKEIMSLNKEGIFILPRDHWILKKAFNQILEEREER